MRHIGALRRRHERQYDDDDDEKGTTMPILSCTRCGDQAGTDQQGTVEMLCRRCRKAGHTLAPKLTNETPSRRVQEWMDLHYGTGATATTHAPVLRYPDPSGKWSGITNRSRNALVPTVPTLPPTMVVPPPRRDEEWSVAHVVDYFPATVTHGYRHDHAFEQLCRTVYLDEYAVAYEALEYVWVRYSDGREEYRLRNFEARREGATAAAKAAEARLRAARPLDAIVKPERFVQRTVRKQHHAPSIVAVGRHGDGESLAAKRERLELEHLGDEIVALEIAERKAAREIAGVSVRRTRSKSKGPKPPRRKPVVIFGDDEEETA